MTSVSAKFCFVSSVAALALSAAAAQAEVGAVPPSNKPTRTASLLVPHCKVEKDYDTRPSKNHKHKFDMYQFSRLGLEVVDGDHLKLKTTVVFNVCTKDDVTGAIGWQADSSLNRYNGLYVVGEQHTGFLSRIWVEGRADFDDSTGKAEIEFPISKILNGKQSRQFQNHEDINELQIVAVASDDNYVAGAYSKSNQIALEGLRVTFDLRWDDLSDTYRAVFRK